MSASRSRLTGSLLLVLLATATAASTPSPQCVVPPPRFLSGALRGSPAAPPIGVGSGVLRATAPSQGTVRILVLLAEFADRPHRIAASRFPDHLFGGGRTLRTYYAEGSGGRLDVVGDVYGWFPLPQSELYYSSGNGGVGAYPNNGQRLAEDAVAAAVSAGVPLSNYDADGDGAVDIVLVIHSGEGYEWAGSTFRPLTPFPDPNAINSHKWVVVNGDFGAGLPRVVDYFTGPEMQRARSVFFPTWSDSISGIGVFCHEFGHVLGLPDIYDTETSESRVGLWEIMDAGTWAYVPTDPARSLPGSLPSRFSAWSRMFLGWTDPVALAPPAGEVQQAAFTLATASTGGAPLQLRTNPFGVDWTGTSPGRGEYFLAEARTREGWDAGLPGDGLLLYHVDESRAGNRASDYADRAGLLLLLPQDGNVGGTQAATDVWPGSSSSFGAATVPSSALHDGADSGVEVSAIAPTGSGAVSLSAFVSNLAVELPLPFARPQPFRPAANGEVALVWSVAASPAATRVTVFDLSGRRVRTLDAAGEFAASGRVARWDGRDEQ